MADELDQTAQYVWRSGQAELVQLSSVEGQQLDRPAQVRILAESASMLVLEVTMTGQSPPHVHGHDSVGYVVSGRVLMKIDGHESELNAGDAFYHPPGATHQMIALDDPSVWLEVKSPPARPWLH